MAQEEQAASSKGNKQKQKEKPDQARETQKDKRRVAVNRKGLSGATSQTVGPLAELDQNNSGQHFQEKFIRWASERPGEGNAEPHLEGVAANGRGQSCAAPRPNPSRTGLLPGGMPCLRLAFSLEKPGWSFAG